MGFIAKSMHRKFEITGIVNFTKIRTFYGSVAKNQNILQNS